MNEVFLIIHNPFIKGLKLISYLSFPARQACRLQGF